MTEPGSPQGSRRKVVRRRRRERQVLVFGSLLIGIAVVVFISMGIYKGTITGPFNEAFVTPSAEFTSDIAVACPPTKALPLTPGEVAVRVLNGTDTPGLAADALGDLVGRGFVSLGATNSSRQYDKTARIAYGVTGLQKAYTVALQFPESELILDTRKNSTVDVVLGKQYKALVLQIDPQLDPTAELTANVPCLPVDQIEPEPAPRQYPADPLASITPSPTASPSPSS